MHRSSNFPVCGRNSVTQILDQIVLIVLLPGTISISYSRSLKWTFPSPRLLELKMKRLIIL